MTSKTRGLARAGLVAKAAVYLVVALLAGRVAAGAQATADSDGALRTVAQRPGGALLVGLLALGLAGYALWNWLNARDADEWKHRIPALGRALLWTGLALSAGRYLTGAGGGVDADRAQASLTARLLDLPLGTWLVTAAGIAIIGTGLVVLKDLRGHRYLDNLCPVSQRTRRFIKLTTVTGLGAKAAVHVLVGAFLVRAAVNHTPRSGVGLDGALSRVAAEPYGTAALAVLSVGLAAYSAWCAVRARFEDVERTNG